MARTAASTSWEEALTAHYEGFWRAEGQARPFSSGPINELPAGFKVLRFRPRTARSLWTYATAGMSQPEDDKGVELHLHTRAATDEVVELLYAVAHYHRSGAKLDHGHTVDFGRPYTGQSKCGFGLLSLPYLDGPALEHGSIEGRPVRFLWLLPITKTERDLKAQHGLDALEDLFERPDFDYADPYRASVA